MGTEGLYDRFHCTEFCPPGYLLLHSGITGQGRPREEGYLIKVLNGITPIDATTSWYYYAFSRNFAVDDEAATEELREGLATVLQEDADALALQEIGMQGRSPAQRDVLIAQDAGVAKARKIMARLIADEQAETHGRRGRPRTRRGLTTAMWMLVRDNAISVEPDGTRTLAACPDSDDRGESWVWSVRRVPEPDGRWRVRVDVDPEQVQRRAGRARRRPARGARPTSRRADRRGRGRRHARRRGPQRPLVPSARTG